MAVSTASPPDVVKASRSLPVIAHVISATVAQQVALDADRESAVELRLDGRHDEVRGVPEQIGAEPVGGVDVLVAVDVPDPRAARALGHDLVDELLPGLVEPDDRAVVGEPRPPQLGEPLRPGVRAL